MQTRTLPDGLGQRPADLARRPKGVATRKASGAVINAIAGKVPELWGGSADLAESNNTTIEDAPSFIPKSRSTKMWKGDPYAGRVLHFGIREHGMGSILNGIAVHGGTRVFGGDLPDLLRLHAPVGAAGRADAAAGDLRVDPRLHRARRGRADPPADRAPRRAAGDPRAGRRTPCGRQRDRRLLAGRARAQRPARRHRPDPAERAGLPARRGRASATPATCTAAATCCSTPRAALPDVVLVGTGSEVQLAVAGPRASWPRRASAPASSRCRAGSGSTSRTPPTGRP